MLITNDALNALLAPSQDTNTNINLILIGMSGSGKTHWSKEISRHYGLEHIEFDDLIGQSSTLSELIKDYPGENDAEKMGNYFGMPWTENFKEKERAFLDIEAQFLRNNTDQRGKVIDLTGSAIYHPDEMQAMTQAGLVIYLETSADVQADMFKTYIAHPKPVCWNDIFEPQSDETNDEALKRCYPLLLQTRDALYREHADIVIPYNVHKQAQTPTALIAEITAQLK